MKPINVFDINCNYSQVADEKTFFEVYISKKYTWEEVSSRVRNRFQSEICTKLAKLDNIYFLSSATEKMFADKYNLTRYVVKESSTIYDLMYYLESCSEKLPESIFVVCIIGTERVPVKYRLMEITEDNSCRKINLEKILYTFK